MLEKVQVNLRLNTNKLEEPPNTFCKHYIENMK